AQNASRSSRDRRWKSWYLMDVSLAAARHCGGGPRMELTRSEKLFDQAQHVLECRVFGAAEPLESDHLGGHELATGPGETIERRVAIALGARATRVGHDPDFELLVKQVDRSLQQADVRLATCDDDAAPLPGGPGLLQMFRQAARVAALRPRRRAQQLEQAVGT